jgi:YebC/PmpR family DNA-binding regulatory protein
MSGHSKWHNIRLRKGKQDAERGKTFTKLAKEIIIAAKNGGGNPDANMRLRTAIANARANSMPADNIKRAVQRGTGEIEGANYEELTYEGYAPGGVAVMVQCLTDNKQRTVADVRAIFSKNGGSLGTSGSVAYLFSPKGVIEIEAGKTTEETIMEVAIEGGAEDVQTLEDGGFEITTAPEDLNTVREAIEAAGVPVSSAEQTMVPASTIELHGKEANQVLRLVDMLEDHDDVQSVHANFDIPEDEMAASANGR